MKTPTLTLVLALSGAALFAQTPEPTPAQLNYAFGLLIGQSLSSTGLTFDLNRVMQGMKDGLTKGTTPEFTVEQAQTYVQSGIQAAQARANAILADKETQFLTKNGQKKGVVTTKSGLQYEVLKKGNGTKPAPSDTVKVDYVGTLPDGTEFDSSAKHGESAVVSLAQVIPAWTEGLQLMPVGSQYRFTVPSKLAYGDQGAGGGVIGPFTTLIFVVDLLSIEPQAPADGAGPP